MQNDKPKSSLRAMQVKKHYPTVIGSLFFTVIQMFFLVLFAWFVLMLWFTVKAYPADLSLDLLIATFDLTCKRFEIFIKFLPCSVLIVSIQVIDGLVLRDKR